jgi:hypothetical protein
VSRTRLVRRVLLPLALAVTALAAVAPSSQAWTLHEHHYEKLLSPGATYVEGLLLGWVPQEITGNIAVYEGAGTVGVCQRTKDETTGVWREGCGNNAVGNALNLTPYYGHFLLPGIKNNSPYTHTIDDYFYSGKP